MPTAPVKENVYWPIGICLVLIGCRLCAAYVFSSFDDAFTTYRYGANLARGLGLVYNENEKVLGTTAPLFAILCSVPAFLSVSVPKFILVFNFICDLGVFLLVRRYFFRDNPLTGFLFGLLFAFDPSCNRIAVGGMEANLFLLCSLSAIVLFRQHRRYVAYVLASVGYFLRPEAVLLLAVLLFTEWRETKKIPFHRLLVCLAVFAGPLMAMWLYYGHLLPQSVIAKNLQGVNPLSGLVKSVFFPTPISFVVFPLAVAGAVISYKTDSVYRIVLLWIALYAAAYLIRGPWILNWYIYPIAVGQLIPASVLIGRLPVNHRSPLPVVLAGMVVLTTWAVIAIRWGRSGVETNIFAPLAVDFKDGHGKGKVFFADDIGALGFYTGGYIYDDLMLVTPQANAYPDAATRIKAVNPDYLFVYADINYLDLLTKDTAISEHYRFVKRYSKSGERFFPAPGSGRPDYYQDFLLMKRIP